MRARTGNKTNPLATNLFKVAGGGSTPSCEKRRRCDAGPGAAAPNIRVRVLFLVHRRLDHGLRGFDA